MDLYKMFGIKKGVASSIANNIRPPDQDALESAIQHVKDSPTSLPAWGAGKMAEANNFPETGELTPKFKPASESQVEVTKGITGGPTAGGATGTSSAQVTTEDAGEDTLLDQKIFGNRPKVIPDAVAWSIGPKAGASGPNIK